MKPLRITDTARADSNDILDYYVSEAGDGVASGFALALEDALRFIASSPGAGSPRLRRVSRRPHLRVWPVKAYPYLVLYDDGPNQTLILRILHAARDIPASLRD